MPKLEYFLLAESISVDAGTRALSIFNVLDEIRPPEFPYILPRVALVSAWISTPQEMQERLEWQLRAEFKVPGQETVDFRGNMTSESKHQHMNLVIREVPINEPGELIATIYLNDAPQATHTLTIVGEANDDG